MKRFHQAGLFIYLGVMISCTPKYVAHFTNSSNIHTSLVESVKVENQEDVIRVNSVIGNHETASPSLHDMDKGSMENIMSENFTDKSHVLLKENAHAISTEKKLNAITPLLPSESQTEFTRAEKRVAKKELKRVIRENIASGEATGGVDPILLVLLCLLLPPLAVYLVFDVGTEFWISLVLTLLFFIPGVIYSLYVIFA